MEEKNTKTGSRNGARKPKLDLVVEFELSPNEITSSEIQRYTSMLNTCWVAVAKGMDSGVVAETHFTIDVEEGTDEAA